MPPARATPGRTSTIMRARRLSRRAPASRCALRCSARTARRARSRTQPARSRGDVVSSACSKEIFCTKLADRSLVELRADADACLAFRESDGTSVRRAESPPARQKAPNGRGPVESHRQLRRRLRAGEFANFLRRAGYLQLA